MVVSVGKATSAEYYVGGGGTPARAESYYLDAVTDGEPPGRWSGSGAAQLGLIGEIDPDDMLTLYGEFINPRTGDRVGARVAQYTSAEVRIEAALAAEPDALPERIEDIRRTIERTQRTNTIGWDATFSPPKSVTVAHTAVHRAELAATRSGDTIRADRFRSIRQGIEQAIQDANGAMLDYAETLTTARAGGGSGAPVEWQPAPGISVASFFQHTSRNIDPQLHIHNVFLNRVICADGKVRSLDGTDFLAQQAALGAVAERVLDERLTAMGFDLELRPDGTIRELTVVPQEVNELFSSRSRQISPKVAELVEGAEERLGRELTDLELHHLKSRATLATRAAKHGHPPETYEEMIDRWAAETPAVVGRSLDSVADDIDAHLEEPRDQSPTTFSADAVIQEAVAACGEERSTWNRANLMLEISRRLPNLGGLEPKHVTALLDQLTDQALSGEYAVQVSGRPLLPDVAAGPLASLTDDPFTMPSARLYACRDALIAETALRQAALTRGRQAIDKRQVAAWLDAHCPTIGVDQRAAVEGIAASDAALTVLVGPAGTGKSFAAGALAGAWQDLTHGRVVGLAVSQVATLVLRDDGIDAARNIDRWLDTQHRLSTGRAGADDEHWRVSAHDVVMVDEASMVATADLERIRAIVDATGARLVLTGDPHQLGAVEAGGVMGLLDGHAETYTLADVRRFTAPWERAASLDLRARHTEALAEYDRHGRLTPYEDIDQAIDAAAVAAVADRLDGRSVVVVAGTNEQAATIAGRVRAQLVELGQVQEDGVLLGRDGCTAGVGDVIACRHNDDRLGVTNRVQYRVQDVGADGALIVVPLTPTIEDDETGASITLPPDYVAEDVQLGYASTVHAAQGLTVDSAHLVTDGGIDAPGLYVAMTRGRHRNTAHVATSNLGVELPPGLAGDTDRPSALAVLEASLERNNTTRAAIVEQEADHERLTSMSLLAGRTEALTREATRARLERHLDDLTAEGALSEDDRARLCADDATEHLARLLRSIEQAGDDPEAALRGAVTSRGFRDAGSVAQVISHRITSGRPHRAPMTFEQPDLAVPADIDDAQTRHLAFLHDQMQARREVLGDRLAADPPLWAVDALGPVPPDGPARDDWQQRAGIIAGHREATRWDDERRPIGAAPGLSATERRASYAAAWEALGRPEADLHEADLSDGRLLVRIRAAETELAWAPPHADDALRAAESDAEQSRQAAALLDARADRTTDAEEIAQLRAEAAEQRQAAELRAAAVEQLTQAAEGRSRWAASAAVTLERGARARREADERGLKIGAEPDRVTAEEWLNADHAARLADDPHRSITELDVATDEDLADLDAVSTDSAEAPADDDTERVPRQRPGAGHERISVHASTEELDLAVAAASLAIAKANERDTADVAATEPERDEAHATAVEADRARRDAADEMARARTSTAEAGSAQALDE